VESGEFALYYPQYGALPVKPAFGLDLPFDDRSWRQVGWDLQAAHGRH